MWQEHQLQILREKDNEDYIPDEEELTEYAKHIGFDKNDVLIKDLLYLAYEGIQAKLPIGWEACRAPDQSIVYRNISTRQVIDEHPLDELYREKVIEMKRVLAQGSASETSQSAIREELSSISEDENQFKNQSEVYEKKRYNEPFVSRNVLREGVSKEGFRSMLQGENQTLHNSALDRNISSKGDGSLFSGTIENKMLPSELLKSGSQIPLKGSIESYLVELAQVEKEDKSQLHSSSVESQEVSKLEAKMAELDELDRQKQMKQALLQQITQSNQNTTLKLRSMLKRKGKKRGTT